MMKDNLPNLIKIKKDEAKKLDAFQYAANVFVHFFLRTSYSKSINK